MKSITALLLLFLPILSFSQLDTAFLSQLKALETADNLKQDTAQVANDALTQKIKKLRSLRKGLTTENVLRVKLMEEQQKDTSRSARQFQERLLREVTEGHTAQLLDNVLVNLYRRTFTEAEIDELIRFYQTSAGQKMDSAFILLMLQSVKDAEQLLRLATAQLKEPKK